MKPFKNYNGGKHGNGTFQNIINKIPPHKIYCEPFVGNGGVFHNLAKPGITVINDLDSSVVAKYLAINKNLHFVKNTKDLLDIINYYKTGIFILNTDYKNLVTELDKLDNVFFYLDPPYLFSTRLAAENKYRHEFTDNDHLEFLKIVTSLKNNVAISHYQNQLYDNAFQNFKTHKFNSMTRAGIREEILYMNYDTPTELQDYRYLGCDFVERQQIKRKHNRLINKLSTMNPIERNMILQTINSRFSTS